MPANCWRSNTLLLRDGNYRVRGVPVYGHYLQALAQRIAVAADRCAREIGGFLKARCGALAAAERQSVGPSSLNLHQGVCQVIPCSQLCLPYYRSLPCHLSILPTIHLI
jgi:hypothetical protein